MPFASNYLRPVPSARSMTILNRDAIERRLDAAAQRFRKTREPQARSEMEWWGLQLSDLRNLAVLEFALERRREEDLRTSAVAAALNYLENRAALKRPFKHFRDALNIENEAARWHTLDAALVELRLALGIYPNAG